MPNQHLSIARVTRVIGPLAVLLGAWALLFAVARAHAQDAPREPGRYLIAASAGVPLRLGASEELGQSTFAPAYASSLLGYVLPGSHAGARGGYRHGVGLAAALNVTRDGGYVDPLYAAQQLVLAPAYLGYFDVGRDVLLLGHVGLPIVVTGGRSFGLEVGALLGYRLLAGTSVFAQLSLDAFAGTRARINTLAALELGIAIDYEVLP